jgi:hypothetical protein
MAVLVEANSVIVRVAAIHEKLQGGMEAFRRLVPNKTFCSDNELARVGFMTPQDVRTFEERLQQHGLIYWENGRAVDFVFANQIEGLTAHSTWAEYGRVPLGGNSAHIVGACRLTGSQQIQVFTPEGWQFEGSMSQNSRYLPEGETNGAPVYIGRQDRVDVYFDPKQGKQVYMGRPFSKN